MALLTFVLFVTPVFAQKWTLPGKGTAVPCTGCVNSAAGKLTYPFNDPLVKHTGRYVDSSSTPNVQNAGMRTVRARVIRTYPERNRMLVQLGEMVGLYKMDAFFGGAKLNAGMIPVNNIATGWTYGYRSPYERLSLPDKWFYAEAKTSGWATEVIDHQRHMNDFDMDDRGNVYIATALFGWGIVHDDGTADGEALDNVAQVVNAPVTSKTVFSLKTGARYYAGVSENLKGAAAAVIYDVTVAGAPSPTGTRRGNQYGVMTWSKYDSTQRLATVNSDGHLRIWDYAAYVNNGNPIEDITPGAGKKFADVAFDESGRLWVGESSDNLSSNQLWKLTATTGGYSQAKYDVYGESFSPVKISVGAGYLGAVGYTANGYDVALISVSGGSPQLLPTDGFFRKYYNKAPTGYAALDFQSPSTYEPAGLQFVEQGNKTYVMYSAGGLGDIFELQGGDSISAAMTANSFGTPNPNSASAVSDGPFYGDTLKFKATASNAAANYSLDWDFDNIDAGSLNNASSGLNETVSHQYTGLNTAAEITAVKNVKVQVDSDHSITDGVSVNLKVPVARIKVPGVATPMTTASRSSFEAVAGETFKDASDGSVEGHYSTWTISGVDTKRTPTGTADVGALGPHTVTMVANYGKYDSTTLIGSGSPFVASVASTSYTVKPFVATLRAPTSSATSFTFNADARVTTNTALLSAAQWVVTWSTEGGAAANAVSASEAQTVAVGTIPSYTVLKSSILNGSVIKLQISVDPSTVPAATYATYTTSLTMSIPDPQIDITSGCINAGVPCTLTASSVTHASTAAWQLSWTIKKGLTTVKTGTTNPIVFTPDDAGAYTASVTETLFNVLATKSMTVAGSTCSPVANEEQATVGTDCGSNCTANTPIQFDANLFGFQLLPCHKLSWTFGDNSAAVTGTVAPTHTYTKNGSYQVKFTMDNQAGSSRSWSATIAVGGVIEPPTCTIPFGIAFTYSGNKGCGPGVPCKTGESIKFTGKRNNGASSLLGCDTTAWTFDDAVSGVKSPSYTFTSTGSHTVTLVVSNDFGVSSVITQTIPVVADTNNSCSGFVTDVALGIEFFGPDSKCATGQSTPCKTGENIQFNPTAFGYSFQTCDNFQWSFGDTATSTTKAPGHAYSTQANSYRVTLKVFNVNNPNGTTVQVDVPFSNVPVKPVPVLAYENFKTTGSVGSAVTFKVNSTLSATGWAWDFGDNKKDNTQTAVVGTTTSSTHTYTAAGIYTVVVKARNSEDTPSANVGQAIGTITITDTPEYTYLLPVVVHGPGQNNSVWRTDVQVFNPDPNASSTNQLEMTGTLRSQAVSLKIPQSTFIYEDFMKVFTVGRDANDSGPVLITTKTKFPPQIWTRTYNQTESGTFGQFIPAIRLEGAGGGASTSSGKYFIAGLRQDGRYRTNLGFINPNAQAINATVRVYDDEGLQKGTFTRPLQPFQLDQFSIGSALDTIPADRPFSVEVEVPDGKWVVAYASFIDGFSNDPQFIQAIRESDLAGQENRDLVVPGIAHVGNWRSNISVFNSNDRKITVDLAYYDTTGKKVAEATNVPVGGGEFLHYEDIVKQGIFGSAPDSTGSLRVTVPTSVEADFFPLVLARTYNDNGSGKTYGQGIDGFASTHANVKQGKPALIPGVRSNTKYYSNLGLTNVSGVDAVVVMNVLDSITGVARGQMTYTLKANQSLITAVDLGGSETASLKIEVTGGDVWAFASIIDRGTFDPEYVPATPLAQ